VDDYIWLHNDFGGAIIETVESCEYDVRFILIVQNREHSPALYC
jgi:hypothetical protein